MLFPVLPSIFLLFTALHSLTFGIFRPLAFAPTWVDCGAPGPPMCMLDLDAIVTLEAAIPSPGTLRDVAATLCLGSALDAVVLTPGPPWL